MSNKTPMTVAGAAALQKELEELTRVTRRKIVDAIAEARAHGDLKENAEYHAAKEQQSFVETRIQEIEGKLSNAQIIDIAKMPHTGRIIFGTTVQLINLDTDETIRYQIVGEDEANIKIGKISVNSPLARALIGKEQGDTVEVTTPRGVLSYEVDEVLYL
ncbi:MAG: greA [Gammaproteobacteria bacterium]|jgi:transcription elongation factor GreA|nr:greA [Gammaproteobacteria bacterium]